jgi:hypothetical protein
MRITHSIIETSDHTCDLEWSTVDWQILGVGFGFPAAAPGERDILPSSLLPYNQDFYFGNSLLSIG